jgi:hypothetical protein
VSREAGRPAAHPLVELVYDLRDAIEDAAPDGTGPTAGRARVYAATRGTLRSARRLVDALELLVAELEARSAPGDDDPDRPHGDREVDDDDFQRITVR